ncbi:MAG: hypothetical protein M0R49_06165 [Limnochordia bacterium]|nr:hypothetical protein [Limnochordia bacterium]
MEDKKLLGSLNPNNEELTAGELSDVAGGLPERKLPPWHCPKCGCTRVLNLGGDHYRCAMPTCKHDFLKNW